MKNTNKRLNTTIMIKNVLLCGLGGVGCVCASSIFDCNEAELKILINEERLNKYTEQPTTFNSQTYDFEFVLPSLNTFKADLIIISTKNDGLDWAIKNIKNFIKEDTIIISLLKGIHSEEKILETYPNITVFTSFYIGTSCIREGRDIIQNGEYKIVVGDKDKKNLGKLKLLDEFLKNSGIKHQICDDIWEKYWMKFMINVGLNQVCSANNLSFKQVKQNSKLVEEMKTLIWEVKILAEKENVNNTQKIYDNTIKFLLEEFEDATPSMLQDLRAKKQTEVDIFAGEVIRLAKKHKLNLKANEKMYKIIKDLEEIKI